MASEGGSGYQHEGGTMPALCLTPTQLLAMQGQGWVTKHLTALDTRHTQGKAEQELSWEAGASPGAGADGA